METEIDKTIEEIAEIFVDEFDAPLQVLSFQEDETGAIYGTLMSSGELYTYALDENELGFVHHEEASQELNNYARGLLSGYGIKTDSLSPYEYMFGLLRMDAQVRCTKGGTPCGKICLPKGATCRKYGSGGGKLKSAGGAIASGAIAGAAAVGTVGAIGGLAYLNRNYLKTGGSAVTKKLKAAAKEGSAEIKSGTELAKKGLKEGFNLAKQSEKLAKQNKPDLSTAKGRESNIQMKATTKGIRGGVTGAASGVLHATAENTASIVKGHLKGAGEDIKTTAKNSVTHTKEEGKKTAKNIRNLFNKKKSDP